jgi:uncharacterized protein involved in exopolysaccharide biosynthesis
LLLDEDILRPVVLRTELADYSWWSRLGHGSDEARTQKAVRRLASKLDIQPVHKSRLIRISYRSSDPRLSAAVLRSLADVEKHTQVRRPSGQQTFFDQQMREARQTLERAQAQLLEFTRTHGVVSAELQRDLTLQKLSKAEAVNMGIETSIAEAGERARSLQVKLANLPARQVSQVRNADNHNYRKR